MNDDKWIFRYKLKLTVLVSAILAVYVLGIRSIPKICSIAHYYRHCHLVQVQCTHYVRLNYQAFLLKQISKSQTDGIQTRCSPSCRAHGLCSHAGSVSLPEELLHCTPRWINKEKKRQTLFTWRGGEMGRNRGQRWRKSSRGSQGENNLIKWEKTEWCGRESESSGAKGEQCPGLTRVAESAQSQQRRPADLLLYRTGSWWCVPPRRQPFHTITSSSNNTIN